MKLFAYLGGILLLCGSVLQAQTTSDAIKDSLREINLQATMLYPLIKSNKEAGVIPVKDIDEKQDPALQYKLIFPLGAFDKNKTQKTNDGLIEVARTLNLHVSAGIPTSHITAVVVVFRQGLNTLLTDDAYKEKYKCSNPNAVLIKELQQAGVRFVTCGQSMARTGISRESMMDGIKVSLSARTAFSYYLTMGYVEP